MKKVICISLIMLAVGCVEGPRGIQGIAGSNGSNGIDGSQGPAGPQGAPGTSVTAVQFCSGPTVYPSTFPEYGFCMGGKIYATYWDGHNAWSAEIVPGHYTTTTSGTNCNFNVGANCAITH